MTNPNSPFSDLSQKAPLAAQGHDQQLPEQVAENNGLDQKYVTLNGLKIALESRRGRDDTNDGYTPSQDALVYMNAAEASIKTANPYKPLDSFDTAHMTKRAPFGEKKPAIVDRSLHPRTTLQEMQAVRANLRVDAINKRNRQSARFTSLYGDALKDKDDVKDLIGGGRYTKGQKAAIRKASRIVRWSKNSNDRIEKRLIKTGRGKDIPGRLTTRHDKITAKVPIGDTIAEKFSIGTEKAVRVAKAIGTTSTNIDSRAWGFTKLGGRKIKPALRKNR